MVQFIFIIAIMELIVAVLNFKHQHQEAEGTIAMIHGHTKLKVQYMDLFLLHQLTEQLEHQLFQMLVLHIIVLHVILLYLSHLL